MHHFRAQNGQFVLNKKFLVQANVITFIYLLVLFIVQNLKKFLQWTQNYDCAPFFGIKWSIPLKQIFFSKIIVWNNFRYHLPSSPFHFAKFKKKFFQWIQSYEDMQFLGPKGPISPNDNFFIKPANEPFIHPHPHAKYRSQILINLLVKYWWLKNTEISLSESHFCI